MTTQMHTHKCEDCGCTYYCKDDCLSETYGTEYGECAGCLGAEPLETTEEGE